MNKYPSFPINRAFLDRKGKNYYWSEMRNQQLLNMEKHMSKQQGVVPEKTPLEFEAKFMFQNETKGALRFQEVNSAGNLMEMSDPGCKIWTIYLRKAALAGKQIPPIITVKVQF